MKPRSHLARRGFLAATLFAGGTALGWLARKLRPGGAPQAARSDPADERLVYDVSAFEKVDPSLLLYDPAGEFPTPFQRVTRLALGANDALWVAGDRAACLFSPRGDMIRRIEFDARPHALHETPQHELVVAFARHFEIFDAAGGRLLRSDSLGPKTFLTSLAIRDRTLYLADAGEREVIICDRLTGSEIDRFGKRDARRNNPGFEIPSPYFDLAISRDGSLRIVNPSRLRIETYTPDGQYQSSWGESGLQIERFCGCCNPIFFALTASGDFITSEKGLARIKIYSPDGQFKGVVAGPDSLMEDKELAKKACQDCSIGGGFDVAADHQNRVFALDPYRKVVRVFTQRNQEAT